MVLISLQPFIPTRVLSLIFALVCASSAAALAESTLVPVEQTPYDHQMTRVEPVLTQKARPTKSSVSLTQVNGWIGDLRSIPYGFNQEWKTPQEVETAPVADCKGKAVALYDRMTN